MQKKFFRAEIKTQYFGKVPKVAWDFFIGGYQPAQKWLKDWEELFKDILNSKVSQKLPS